ncbi:MAG: HAD-IA family hydrolase [Woeseiaceae bacterium]
MPNDPKFEAVLFDLDGTLVDTAPDMVDALIAVQSNEGHQPISYDLARSHVSHGAIGLINVAFPDVDADTHERLRLQFLELYEQAVCVRSSVFEGLNPLLDQLDAEEIPWGVVTNKPMRMTDPLMAALGIDVRAACAISGDTIPQRKPDPAPLFLASKQTGIAPSRSVYIGDALRDIQAGRAAGMHTVAAAYGYVTADDDPASWDAHELVSSAEELAHLVLKGVNLAP